MDFSSIFKRYLLFLYIILYNSVQQPWKRRRKQWLRETNKNKIRVYEPVETCYNFHQISGAKDQKAGASSLARGFLIS